MLMFAWLGILAWVREGMSSSSTTAVRAGEGGGPTRSSVRSPTAAVGSRKSKVASSSTRLSTAVVGSKKFKVASASTTAPVVSKKFRVGSSSARWSTAAVGSKKSEVASSSSRAFTAAVGSKKSEVASSSTRSFTATVGSKESEVASSSTSSSAAAVRSKKFKVASSSMSSSTTTTASEQLDVTSSKTFPFLKLPVELRTRVYKLVLVLPRTIKAERHFRQPVLKSTTRSGKTLRGEADAEDVDREFGITALAVASSCRQIYLECVSIYYRENHFYCRKYLDLHHFLAAIGPTNIDLITSIFLSRDDWQKTASFRSLAGMEGLKQIRLWDWYGNAPIERIIPAVSLQDFVFPRPKSHRVFRFTLCCRGRTVADREKCEAKDGSFDCWVNDTPADKQCARQG